MNIGRPPYTQDVISLCDGVHTPSQVKNTSNTTYYYWERSLYERMFNTLEFQLPSDWSGSVFDFFMMSLYARGFLAVFDTTDYGLIFQPATISGYTIYYQPSRALISNPYLPTGYELKIGEQCELLKITKDYRGLWDVINYYAEKLSLLDSGVDMSIINSKTPFLFGARDKGTADTIKAAFDKINSGVPTVVVSDSIVADKGRPLDDLLLLDRQNIKQSYIGSDLIDDQLTLLRNFDREIGIPTIPERKKERLISSETEIGTVSSSCRALQWVETFNASAQLVNAMFGTSISCRYRYGELLERGGDIWQTQD